MKINEITEIIEVNPRAIFIDHHSSGTYTIEGFTKSANGARMVVTRGIWGRYDIETDTVIIKESETTRTRQTNAVGCLGYGSELIYMARIRSDYQAEQARTNRINTAREAIAELKPQLAAALKANGIEEMYTSRLSFDTDYKLTLSHENAAKLLALLNAGAAQ